MSEDWRDFDPSRPWTKFLKLGLDPKATQAVRRALIKKVERFSHSASRIAQRFAESRSNTSPSPKAIGTRTTKRNPVPPFMRPGTLFKRDVYQLALDIQREGIVREIEATVRLRDEPYRHKPRNPTPVDWAIRLVDRAPRGAELQLNFTHSEPLLDPTQAGHLALELNFALRHQIDPRCVAMFVDQVGGYEIISAMLDAGGYDLTKEDWISGLKGDFRTRTKFEGIGGRNGEDYAKPITHVETVKAVTKSPPQRRTVMGEDDEEDWG